jgi:phosphatidylglycerophosphate synthase
MNLHRIETQTEWDSLKKENRNHWQRIANSTHGALTPGNIITLGGLILVFYGLWHIASGDTWTGLVSLVLGRACDLFDGWVAEATGTKSFLGELFDASADKIATILTLTTLGITGIIPWLIIAGLVIPHLLIPVIIYFKRRKSVKTHPSPIGKLSMAAVWISVAGYLLNSALVDNLPEALLVAVFVITAFAIISGFYTLLGYLRNPAK